MMSVIEPPDSHFLHAAIGWLGLGDYREAQKELANIQPSLQEHPEVLEVRWDICAKSKTWGQAVEISRIMVKMIPDQSLGWINLAYALHELKRTQEAFDVLLPTVSRFPTVWTIPYNLACYCSAMGRLDAAENWLKAALTIDDKTVRENALQDPDLAPLLSRKHISSF